MSMTNNALGLFHFMSGYESWRDITCIGAAAVLGHQSFTASLGWAEAPPPKLLVFLFPISLELFTISLKGHN